MGGDRKTPDERKRKEGSMRKYITDGNKEGDQRKKDTKRKDEKK
jgi:hypothetical protein